ncbi:hypothetical protein ASZ90_007098 [hydrocarbon metagenome]|uniref:Exopolysaccharide biosynthesis protein n=1 Tax=hydrocarbon metagenome TaxID=938273 RepID=A0A0W8FQD1_9ZZZZ
MIFQKYRLYRRVDKGTERHSGFHSSQRLLAFVSENSGPLGLNDGTRMSSPRNRPHSVAPLRLSEEIGLLVATFAERRVRLHEVVEVTQGRGYTLLLILLALPFCTPIPLPGVSMPFGMVIAIIGFRLTLRQQPWLPERLLATKLPQTFFPRFLAATRRLVRGMEWFARPRWVFLVDTSFLHHVYGAMILVSGLLLLLPVPLPFSNGLPALTVVLLAAALLERDGCLVLAGLLMFTLTAVYFSTLLVSGSALTECLHQWGSYLFTGGTNDVR